MTYIKKKPCVVCGEIFQPTGRCAKYCSKCKKDAMKKTADKCSKAWRYKRAIKEGTLDRYGIGRGGKQPKGGDSPHYKNGTGSFNRRSREIRVEIQYCERCGKDLKEAVWGHWCVHHKDHNRENNVADNFELLCKRCHQIEHKCWENYNK